MLEQRARFAPAAGPVDLRRQPRRRGAGRVRPRPAGDPSWVEQNFDFSGYVTGFDPCRAARPDRAAARLGLRAGRAAVHRHRRRVRRRRRLLRRVLDAVPLVRRLVPDLRFLVVTGPRIDPAVAAAPPRATTSSATCPTCTGDLAACDVAVVQGGLTTCMELTAAGTPFVYVPLRHHFEQNFHVRHGGSSSTAPAAACDYEEAADPDLLAEAVIAELTGARTYRPVETDGAGGRPRCWPSCCNPRG